MIRDIEANLGERKEENYDLFYVISLWLAWFAFSNRMMERFTSKITFLLNWRVYHLMHEQESVANHQLTSYKLLHV